MHRPAAPLPAAPQLFREALLSEGFIEIHTPKLLSGASEGGAAVFRFDYMGRPGCLAQARSSLVSFLLCFLPPRGAGPLGRRRTLARVPP